MSLTDLRRAALMASPLLFWAWLGAASAPRTLLAWGLLTTAAALAFASSPGAVQRWALALWLYATPALGFLREGPSLSVGAGLVVCALGFRVATGEGRTYGASAAIAALGAMLGWAMAGGAALADFGAQPPDLAAALFSSRQGLLFHWPILWTGLAGLPLASLRAPTRAAAAGGLAVLVLAAACLPASRPAVGLLVLPFITPGLLATLQAARDLAATRPLLPLTAAAALLVLWNMLFMSQYRDGLVPRDDTVSFAEVAEGNAELFAQGMGSPSAWPANWFFAWRHRLSPDRFDLMVGKELVAQGDRLELDVGRLHLDDALLIEGWSVRHPCGSGVCRAVEGQARVFLPLPDGEWGALLVAGGEGEGRFALRVTINGHDAGWLSPPDTGTEARLPTPSTLWHRGLNEVVLQAPQGPALVDCLAVERNDWPSTKETIPFAAPSPSVGRDGVGGK